MNKGYFVREQGVPWGIPVVATSVKEAKRIAFTASEMDCDWIDLRCKWMGKANVDGMPVGIVTDFMKALRRGIIQYVEEGDCDICDATNTYLTAIDGAAVCCDCMDSRLTVMEGDGL